MPRKYDYNREIFYGLNYRDPVRCKHGEKFYESIIAKNIILNKDGGFTARPGRTTRSTLPAPIHSKHWFVDVNDSAHMLVGAGDTLYDDGDISGSPTASLTGLTNNTRSNGVSYLNYFWFCNGVDANKKFNGTTWTNMSIAAPSAAPTIADGGAGGLTGGYQYVYVYVYVDAVTGYEAESRYSSRADITVSSKQIDVSVVADPTGEATYIRIYRRSSNALDYKACPLDGSGGIDLPNTSTTYTDNTAEADMGAVGRYLNEGEVLDTDFSPVILSGIAMWKSRLWGWSGSYLYRTVQGRPGDWYNESSVVGSTPLNMDPQNNENILTCFATENALVVLTESKLFLIVGDAEPFAVIDKKWGIDCIADRSLANCAGILRWLGSDGVYEFDGYSKPENISRKINRDAHGFNRGILDNQISKLQYACGLWNPFFEQYELSVPENDSDYNKKTFVYRVECVNDLRISPWSEYDYGFESAVNGDGNRIFTASKNEYVYYEDNIGIQDDSTDYTWEYETRKSDFSDKLRDKVLDDVTATGAGATATITFTTKVDVLNYGVYTDEFDLTLTGDEWADSGDEWSDTGDFWEGTEEASRTLPYGQEMAGAYVGFNISGDKHASFYGFALTYFKIKRNPA